MLSAALDAILTTLRYLAPATLLTLFWGQHSFLFKFLRHIDTAFRSIVFSSEEQKQQALKWLAEAGSVRVERLDTVWRHGWILCGVLDAALPGACAGHPPTRLSLKHAQTIADHYLGVEPVFSRQELESDESLSKHQEWKLATYLERIRQSLAKLTPPVSKPNSQRTSPESSQFTLDYVARGSGLTAAQVKSKGHFKVYPTSQQSLDPGEITILIRGPKDAYGMAVLPPVLGKAQLIRQKLLGLQSKSSYTENILPLTQGATYLRSYGKNDMNKTYHIPKTKYDIEIDSETRPDHIKVSYVVNIEGKYEISITSRGQSIVGSPFSVTVSRNIISVLENDPFCLENGEEIDIVDVKTDRKVILRIVDFVTEKMLLRENGCLEKISDNEAKILMSTEIAADSNQLPEKSDVNEIITTKKVSKFINIVNKVILMNKVCKILKIKQNNYNNYNNRTQQKSVVQPRREQDIPDIVNSTLIDMHIKPFTPSDIKKTYIVPESISVSLKTEIPYKGYKINQHINMESAHRYEGENASQMSNQELSSFDNETEDILKITSSPNNPFLEETYNENFMTEKKLGTYVSTEYETNNSQNEEIPPSPVQILIDEIKEPPASNNPFVESDVIPFERPKTPVYKIITGDVKNRNDSVYVDPKIEQLNEETFANEFVNPFFIHQHHHPGQKDDILPVTDFIIGAPVSLPPIIRASSPIPNLQSLIVTTDNGSIESKNIAVKKENTDADVTKFDGSSSIYTTSLHTNMTAKTKTDFNPTIPSNFDSLDSNVTQDVEILSVCENQFENLSTNSNITSKKDIWDSAYVSIDDNNSSPDSNNNDNTLLSESVKQKNPIDESLTLKREELLKMGPAERELWQTCDVLSDVFKSSNIDESKITKFETRRPTFTPIIEESERSSITTTTKDTSAVVPTQPNEESDIVTVAFAGLNEIYSDVFSSSETESTTSVNEENKLQSLEVEYIIESAKCVDSASEKIADVKRQTNTLEGKISEVQANVTESHPVSQTLQKEDNVLETKNEDHDGIQFGSNSRTNIVLERKKYWDDRIRLIEAKSQESSKLQKKRRLSSKYLRYNDSLTKRRGKQVLKKITNTVTTETIHSTSAKTTPQNIRIESSTSDEILTDTKPDVKLVTKWKKYWDDKLETENADAEITCFKLKNKTKSQQKLNEKSDIVILDSSVHSHLPVKQELSEEVFKAFETSPKRFFGTSRKQILNKIDTFLGNPSTAGNSSTDVSGASPDSGLVSSRISLFHNITNTEEPLIQRKSNSMYNIDKSKCDTENITNKFDDFPEHNKGPEGYTKSISSDSTDSPSESLKEKRNRITSNIFNKSFEETGYTYQKNTTNKNRYVYNRIQSFDKDKKELPKINSNAYNSGKCFSKSEMDIFNKTTSKQLDNDLDKYRSCDELPKINVKNFISLYESVSQTSKVTKNARKISRVYSDAHTYPLNNNSQSDAVRKSYLSMNSARIEQRNNSENLISSKKTTTNKSCESIGSDITSNDCLLEEKFARVDEKESTFLSLSDIEIEIIESCTEKSSLESSPEREMEKVKHDYKSRFKMAKQFFQSLEELREPNKRQNVNEREQVLKSASFDSTESRDYRPSKRVKKNIKSHSMPSSEISKIWNQLQEKDPNTSKLVKISEKFNVDDLFTDVMEGRLSRQGSLRGIPHKKAVLEAFRSMENLSVNQISPYDIAVSQLNDFAKENQIKNAQTYLTEYPYLPTTDPSKYQSRLDTRASGLITLKELLNKKPRRNSVPDIRLNASFTANL
ncbi:hypothetical protein ACJJTC_014797 [Scirpophaga incertulas]